MGPRINFDKGIRRKSVSGNQYDVYEVILRLNGETFNNNRKTAYTKRIQNAIQTRYWNALKALYLPSHVMAVRLSGIHFHIEDVKKYMSFEGRRLEMILSYVEWKEKGGGHVVDAFAIIESDKKLFSQLLHEFWFALGFELHFEGIILPPDKIYDIEKWSRRIEGRRTYDDLMQMSSMVLDNQHNGFHFKVTSKPKYFRVVKKCLSKFGEFELKL